MKDVKKIFAFLLDINELTLLILLNVVFSIESDLYKEIEYNFYIRLDLIFQHKLTKDFPYGQTKFLFT